MVLCIQVFFSEGASKKLLRTEILFRMKFVMECLDAPAELTSLDKVKMFQSDSLSETIHGDEGKTRHGV